ncbi:MAG: site-specific integrase, partial [Planctomycetota bacterium]
ANRTANLIGTTVAACLNWAVDAGLIASSPIGKLKKLPETRDHQRCRRRALSDTEIGRFLTASRLDDDVAAANPAYTHSPRIPQTPLWVALLDTGARYGELRQLTWGDVSFKEGLLTLRAESTKSRRARAIPMTAALAQELQGLRVAQQRRRQRLPTASEPVFLSPRGEPWRRYTTNPMRIFVRVLDAAEIPRMDALGEKLDIHALRHSFASRLARNGVALTQAQRLLGHSDPKLTAAVYTHLDAEDLRSAITQIQPAPMPTPDTQERRASE